MISSFVLIFAACATATFGKFCEEGDEVEVACPDGYLVTGVETTSKIFSRDSTPVCSKIADKIIPEFQMSSTHNYNSPYPLVQAECGGSDPIVLKFSMCFEDDVITSVKTHCRRFQEGVRVNSHYNLEGLPNSTVLKCPGGSFFNGLRMERDSQGWHTTGDQSDVKVRGKCTGIEV